MLDLIDKYGPVWNKHLTPNASSIYCVVFEGKTGLKIGKANKVYRRIDQVMKSRILKKEKIDYSKSFALLVTNEKTAYRIERELKNQFHDDRLRKKSCDGGTEFFHRSCLEEVEKAFLDHERNYKYIKYPLVKY